MLELKAEGRFVESLLGQVQNTTFCLNGKTEELLIIHLLNSHGFKPLLHLLEHRKQRRNGDKQSQGAEQHATYHAYADGAAAVGSCTRSEH